jgi:hypothetical protein
VSKKDLIGWPKLQGVTVFAARNITEQTVWVAHLFFLRNQAQNTRDTGLHLKTVRRKI